MLMLQHLNQYKPLQHNVQIIANVSSSQYGGCTVDRVDELLSKYAQMNAQHHREVANDFVQPDKIENYVIHK